MPNLSVVSAHQLKPGTIAAVIPKAIREKIGIDRGTELVVYESEGEVIMVPLSRLKASRRAQGSSKAKVRISASSD